MKIDIIIIILKVDQKMIRNIYTQYIFFSEIVKKIYLYIVIY